MNGIPTMKPQGTVNAANDWLDDRGPLAVLQNQFDFTTREIDELSLRHTGQRCSPAVISKFVNRRPNAPKRLPGVPAVAIIIMGYTPTGIARRALLTELALREAVAEARRFPSVEAKDNLKRFIQVARTTVANERQLVTQLVPADLENRAERGIDLGTIDYLEGLTYFHEARLLPLEDTIGKRQRLESALALMAAVSGRLDYALRAGARCAEVIDLILAVNARLNEYFGAFELDDLAQDPAFTRARSVADKIAAPLFLLAADACASFQSDPRVAFNAASGAGLANQHAAAAKRLALSARLDGFQGNNISDWHADWILEPLSNSDELAEAIKILKRK